ncbi:GNAT family N-acetyltransferase [Amycolatopsis sp. NPDC051372]|uniref:GNAT family N-acetyltransferase n=1 Tax=Amycolatopsis sp. NPDC051372 TaxID=3155669 RepID=UPI0034171D50
MVGAGYGPRSGHGCPAASGSRWVVDGAAIGPPLGRWKVADLATGHIVGAVSLLPLPPGDIDSEIGVQIARGWWGSGYAGEVGDAIAHYAFAGADEIFAVSRPANQRAAAAARRMEMGWVGRTDKHYDTRPFCAFCRSGDEVVFL